MKNIVFAVSEMEGLIKTGGLADIAKALPQALNKLDQDARITLPYYNKVAKILPIKQAVNNFSFTLSLCKNYLVTVREFFFNQQRIYCFDIPDIFDREGIYAEEYEAYQDNGERFAVFSIAILEFFEHFADDIQFKPNIFHCNDWHTALIPFLFQQSQYWKKTNCETLLTIHNGAFQGIFHYSAVPSLVKRFASSVLNHDQEYINYLKLGILHTSKVVAVSPNYAKELLTPLGSHNLYDTFQQVKDRCCGVLNGCAYEEWSPESDEYIFANYDIENLKNKAKNKSALQKQLKLKVSSKTPVIAQVSRLTDQKGLDYLIPAIKELLQHRIQIVIAGQGDPYYVEQLEQLAAAHPDKLHFHHDYSEELAHKYMAGADYFLMPSLFEPCGLTQMYALAYGTLPIVREVGGLKDTVFDLISPDATGIVFANPSQHHLISAVRRALLFYHECPKAFKEVQIRAMKTKFSWLDSANQYVSIYHTLIPRFSINDSIIENFQVTKHLDLEETAEVVNT